MSEQQWKKRKEIKKGISFGSLVCVDILPAGVTSFKLWKDMPFTLSAVFLKKKKTKKSKKKGEEEEENNEGKIPLESEAGFFCCSLRLLMNEESLPLQDWMPVLYSRCATLPEKTDCRPLAIVYGNWTQRIDRWMPLTTGSHIGYWPLCCYRTCPPSTLKVTLHLNIHRNGYIETSQ